MSQMNSFEDAFYIIAKELGLDYAQPLSPREVFDQQMLPRIKELVASQAVKTGQLQNEALVECVVVESDWPEYEPTWAAIQARVINKVITTEGE